MRTPFLHLFVGGLGVIVLFAACSFPGPNAPEPNPEANEPAPSEAPSPEPVALVEPQHELGDTLPWYDGGLLVYIPAGEFVMGGAEPEDPERTVVLSDFWIYRTEVTNRMYARCVSLGFCTPPVEDPSYPDYLDPVREDHPVVGVNWDQATAYCGWMGGAPPTEAQWEKTARGPDGDLRPWGDGEPTCDLLNFDDCVGDRSKVQAYPEGKSYYEVLDMAGNVFEWTLDWYQEGYYASAPAEDPLGPESGQARSVRGSAFGTEAERVLSALRFYLEPEKERADLGFRCVVADPYEYAPPCEWLAHVEQVPPGEPVDPLAPEPVTCIPDPVDVNPVTDCMKLVRLVNINYLPGDADASYSSTATCTDSPGQISCWGYGGETLEYSICTSCEPVPT